MGRQQRGASLVEVLVVIGILAIGILAFIRLYPSGFLALKRSGQSDAATRLAQQEMERLKTRAENLPRLIAPTSYDFSSGDPVLFVDPSIDPNDLGVQPNLPEGFPTQYASGVNRFRRISGERVNLGLPGPTLGSRDQLTEGIVYTTLFAPIAQTTDSEGGGDIPIEYLTVTGAPMRRLILDSDFQRPNIRLFEYGIDYNAGKVLLRPLRGASIQYQVEYSVVYVAQSGRVESLFLTEIITLPPTFPNPPTPVWVDLPIPDAVRGSVLGIAPFSDVVARVFERLPAGAPWSEESPYQYKVLNPLTGTILISPRASGFYERFWRGTRPLEAYVSYFVHDWSIMREEFTVPNSGRLRLAFTDLKQVGDQLDDQTIYTGMGLGRNANGEPLQADLIIVDMLTGRAAYFAQGAQIPNDQLAPALRNQTLPNLGATIDYGTGNVQIANPDMRGRKVRVFYKVHENWTISVQKAADRYYLVQDPRTLTVDSCWYDFNAAYNGDTTDRARRLYFTPSEAGKTVLLREYWYVDTEGRTQRGTNGVFKISDILDGGRAYLDLRDLHPNAVRWDPGVTGQAIRGVQGLSVKVRVTHEPPGRRTRTDFDILLPVRD
ncbi:MAG: prepilin-type N-terminal cleavage/methylation domain-containing protein [Fimbriimonadales bacterium]|nr:prepilin-type N-terminal cleavage/methylation domain-containing protein [Fimbriimonadales bacterium]